MILLCWICYIRALDSETYARELFEECVIHLKERLKEKERLREEEKVNGRIVTSPFIYFMAPSKVATFCQLFTHLFFT